MSVEFREATYLWLLIPVAVVAVVQLWMRAVRLRTRRRFTSDAMLDWVAPRRPGLRTGIVAVGLVAALGLVAMAAARPARAVEIPYDLSTVIVALDTSASMGARDVAPNRMSAAQAAALQFVKRLPTQLRVGYVTFSDSASLEVAPTEDRARIRSAIERTDLQNGTAIGEGIFKSLDAIALGMGLEPVRPGANEIYYRLDGSAIVLLSDGKTNAGRSNESATQAAKSARVPVSTIAFGTPEGTLNGDAVPVNIPALRSIADSTKGKFFEAKSALELQGVYREIQSRIAFRTEYRDVTGWFVAMALAVMLLTALGSLLWFARMP